MNSEPMDEGADKGAESAADFELTALQLISASGKLIDLSMIMIELNIFEDLFSPVLTGTLLIADVNDLTNVLPIIGYEYLQVSFNKMGENSTDTYSKTFRIYKKSEQTRIGLQPEIFILHFCSEELLINESTRVSKSYANMTIDQIIYDIGSSFLKIGNKRFPKGNVQLTSGIHELIVPNWKPFQAINWLCQRAISPVNRGATFLFYETQKGFYFSDLQTLAKQKPVDKLIYGPKAVDLRNANFGDISESGIEDYVVKNMFDTLSMMQTGGLAGTLIAVDPLRQSIKETKYTLPEQWNKTQHLNQHPLTSYAKTRTGKALHESSESFRRVHITTLGHDQLAYARKQKTSLHPNNVEQWFIPRTMYFSHLKQIKLEVVLPGHPTLQIGHVVDVEIPAPDHHDPGDPYNVDKHLSGRFLITALRHKIDRTAHSNIVELVKDSSIVPPTQDLNMLQEVRKL